MAAISTVIAAIGVAAGIAGTVVQYGAMQKAEKKREELANLDALRQKREQVRKVQIARAQALAAGVAAGTQDSSSVQGGMGSASSQGAYNIQGISQSRQIGSQISSANQQANFGAALSSLGGAVVNMSDTLGRIGEYASSGFGSKNQPYWRSV